MLLSVSGYTGLPAVPVAHLPTASTTTATIQKRIFKNRRMLYLMKGHFRVLTNPSTLGYQRLRCTFTSGWTMKATVRTT